MTELFRVFQHAALPQKAVFLVLLASFVLALVSVVFRVGHAKRLLAPPLSIPNMAVAAPALGLLAGAMTAFHMMETTLRLAASPSAKELAPGVMEVAALVGLGALAGLAWAVPAVPSFGAQRSVATRPH